MARRRRFERFFDADYVALLRDTSPPSKTRREVDFIVRSLRLPPRARILDVPCGYGRHSAALVRRGFRVVGVDLSRAMIADARRRWTEGPRLRFIQKDMRRQMFREVGLRFVKAYSGYDGRTYRKISKRRLIVVGARRR